MKNNLFPIKTEFELVLLLCRSFLLPLRNMLANLFLGPDFCMVWLIFILAAYSEMAVVCRTLGQGVYFGLFSEPWSDPACPC